MTLTKCVFYTKGKFNRPELKLEIYRVDNAYRSRIWQIFRKYHYLNTDLHQAAAQYVGIMNGRLVCHTGVIQFPMRKNTKRVHRLVVLPDYQGIGIGTHFIKEVAKIYKKQGYEFNLTTTTPALTHALAKDPEWLLSRYGREKSAYDGYGRYKGANLGHLANASSIRRVTFSFWYEGI